MGGASPAPGQPQTQFPVSGAGLTHEAPQERLLVDKYHLLWVFEKMQRRGTRPRGEWCLIPAGMFLGLMIPLVTGVSFADALGLSKYTWQAIVVIAAGIAAVATIVLGVWWAMVRWKNPRKQPEQVLAEMITEMAEDRERIARLQGPQG